MNAVILADSGSRQVSLPESDLEEIARARFSKKNRENRLIGIHHSSPIFFAWL